MTLKRIVVRKGKEKRIVQRSVIPDGFTYVEDYKEPKKASSKKKDDKKQGNKK